MASSDNDRFTFELWVYLGVRTCELFLCFVAIVRVRVRVIMLTSLFSLFYVTREFHRFLHRGRACMCCILETGLTRNFAADLSLQIFNNH